MDRNEQTNLSDIVFAGAGRSETLRSLREIGTFVPWMRAMGLPAQFRVIVDANVVFGELIWLTGRRANPKARTGLQELVDAGTLIAVAPISLDHEVHEHAERIAATAGVSVDSYLVAWKTYRKSIIFMRPRTDCVDSRTDPDDAPYVSTYEEVGAHAVYSNDHHISQMGARTIGKEVIITLKNYSRAASWEYTIKYGSVVAAFAGWQSLIVTLRMLGGIASVVRSSPRWVQCLLLASGIGLLAHPTSRAWLIEKASSLGNSLFMITARGTELATKLGAQAVLATQQADKALVGVKRYLTPRKVPLRVLVRAVCMTGGTPLSLEEIEQQVMANGYQSNAKDFKGYLRRVLRESADLTQVHRRWTCVPVRLDS